MSTIVTIRTRGMGFRFWVPFCICVFFVTSLEAADELPHVEKRIIQRCPNGQAHIEETYRIDHKGRSVQHGVATYFFENGRTNIQVTYANGKRNGPLTEWNALTGTIIRQGNFTNDLEAGKWTWWQPTGEKLSECTYKAGKIVGKKISWFNGKPAVEETYNVAGELVQSISWHQSEKSEQQKMAKRGTFKDGKKHGKWTYWNEDGTIKADGEWKNGKPWSGVCGVPVAGDAGSWGGLEVFSRFANGKKVDAK